MIDHVSIAVSDLGRAAAFYDQLLAALGYDKLVVRPNTVGYGKKYPEFWLNHRPEMKMGADNSGAHICLRCRTSTEVEAFHGIAIENGGSDEGKPGPREAAMTTYYGAFIKDTDGNKIEAICFPKSD